MVLLAGSGLRAVTWTTPQGAPFTVSLLQGNIPQSLKWVPEQLELSLRTYAELAEANLAPLAVLPETAIPLLFEQIPREYLMRLTDNQRHVLLGSAVNFAERKYANGAVLITPQGSVAGKWFKRHLVPFGEFTPRGFSWFLDLMNIPMSGFTAGQKDQQVLQIDAQKIAPNICYEDLLGEELMDDVPQSTLLINLSNTAWFGHSLAQPQHLQIAQMRAMETGRMMLRATNTGMTAAITPDGNIVSVLPPFTRGALTVEAQGYTGETPYVRIGNAGVMVLIALVFGWAWRRKPRSMEA
jgi:apolipoprotein N-acyltransferase